jgi:hypothetical protein
MSRSRRIFASLGSLALLGLAASCSANKQTELVAGVSTQVEVPRDIRYIRLDVKVDGVSQLCNHYKVFDGKVQLPRTLGSVPIGQKGRVISFVLTGILTDLSQEELFNDCQKPPGFSTTPGTRVIRHSKQPYLTDKILFVPLPLKYSCFDKDCGTDQTCKAGRCVDAAVDPNRLPEYRDSLLFGDTSTCFSVDQCLGQTAPAQVVDADKCIYKVPGGPPPSPLPSTGLNVRAVYDGGFTKEILDIETKDLAEEGYFVPDPAKPQEFQLAPGMCDLVKGIDSTKSPPEATAHRISALEVSYACNSKTAYQPICTSELNKIVTGSPEGVVPSSPPKAGCTSTELKIAPSALVVLLEKTQSMGSFYSDAAITAALNLSLSDPAFRNTQVAMRYVPRDTVTEACDAYADPAKLTIPFKLADAARTDLVTQIKSVKDNPALLAPPDARLNLDGALTGAYALLRGLGAANKYNKRAVLVLGNHDFVNNCGAASTGAVAAAAFEETDPTKGSLATYTVLFGPKNAASDAAVAVAADISAKGSGNKVPSYDAREQPAKGFEAFYQVVGDLGACVYDQPTKGALEDKDSLSYYDPIKQTSVVVPFVASCSTTGTGNGWGKDSAGRIRMCGTVCSDLRATLTASAVLAGQNNTTPPGIPVFARKSCQ